MHELILMTLILATPYRAVIDFDLESDRVNTSGTVIANATWHAGPELITVSETAATIPPLYIEVDEIRHEIPDGNDYYTLYMPPTIYRSSGGVVAYDGNGLLDTPLTISSDSWDARVGRRRPAHVQFQWDAEAWRITNWDTIEMPTVTWFDSVTDGTVSMRDALLVGTSSTTLEDGATLTTAHYLDVLRTPNETLNLIENKSAHRARSSQAVPEPSASIMAVLGVLLCLRRMQR